MELFKVENLSVSYPVKGSFWRASKKSVKAVSDVSFSVNEGETLGIVGESGCGKSTLAKALIRIEKPTSGKIFFEGKDCSLLKGQELRYFQRSVQIVFQDPFSSLNPRMSVASILQRPLDIHENQYSQIKKQDKIVEILEKVGLGEWALNRYCHEFSGGQRQRVAIARAIILNPKVVIADEAVSALDVSIQAQIMGLLKKIQDEMGVSFVFISHDLAVIRQMCHRVGVMYLGKFSQLSNVNDLYDRPLHPYTQYLLHSIPQIGKKKKSMALQGDVPSPLDLPEGCFFNPRCPFADDLCRQEIPLLDKLKDSSQMISCHQVKSINQYPQINCQQ